jgi:hypothetical protein
MNLRKTGIAIAMVLIAVLGSSVMAGATTTKKIKSHVKITKTSPKFKGKVSSPNSACVANRTVKLYAVEPGNEVVGSAKTDNHGNWKIQFQGDGIVHYYAKVLKRSSGAAGTIYVCKHARSEKVLQANAKATVYDTDLKLSAHFPTFHGKVKSSNDFCVGDRKVRMFRKVLGHGDSNDKLLGKTQSKGNGQWKVKYDDVSTGAYYAKVGKLQSASLGIRCKADRSNILAAD